MSTSGKRSQLAQSRPRDAKGRFLPTNGTLRKTSGSRRTYGQLGKIPESIASVSPGRYSYSQNMTYGNRGEEMRYDDQQYGDQGGYYGEGQGYGNSQKKMSGGRQGYGNSQKKMSGGRKY